MQRQPLFERPFLIAIGISAILFTIVLISPLSTDDIILRSMAMDFYTHRALPYFGSWDQNFPGILLVQYLAIVFFGMKDLGLHLFDGIAQLGFLFIFYRLLRKWLTARASAIAILLYMFYYVTGRGSLYTERDVYGIMSIVIALYCVLRPPSTAILAFLIGGLFTGFAILIRPTFGVAYLLIAAMILLRDERPAPWGRFLAYSVASAVPFAAFLFYYGMIPGGLEAVYDSTIRFNLDLYENIRGHVSLFVLAAVTFWRGLILPLAITGLFAIKWSIRKEKALGICAFPSKKERWMYGAMIVSFFLVAMVQPTYLAYHFAPFYVLLVPMAAIGVEAVMRWISSMTLKIALLVIVLGVYLALMMGGRKEIAGAATALVEGRNVLEASYDIHHEDPSFGAVPQEEVLRFLCEPGNDTGAIEICSFEPALRLHLDRNFAGPYILPSAIALNLDGGTSRVPRYTDYQNVWRKAYMDSLCRKSPAFIILARNTEFWYLKDPYNGYLHNLPGFDSLLRTSYRYDTSFGCYQIFQRRNQRRK